MSPPGRDRLFASSRPRGGGSRPISLIASLRIAGALARREYAV